MTDDFADRYRAALDACTETVTWHPRETPAAALRRLADEADELGVDRWDSYGERGAVALLEAEVAELLGKPTAVFFPSGVMGQQAALRSWCDRRGSSRIAIPDLAHPLVHEADGPRVLQGFRFEHLTTGRRTPTAADLHALPAPDGLGAVAIELPLREAGCLLPTWEELAELSTAARELGVPLHVDGARLWESQPFYDRPLAEVAGLADSVYVSFYKGLAGLAGAAVVGPADLADELRVWRQRMGGTLYRLTPYALAGLAGLREHQPRMGEYVAWARAFAAALVDRGLRVVPDPPHTNTFLCFAGVGAGVGACVGAEDGADVVNERLLEVMARDRVDLSSPWRPADAPGVVVTEVTAYAAALDHDPATVADRYAEITGTG